MDLADCYRMLGLRTGASYEDIKASYRRLARLYHPDANPHQRQQAQDKFIRLTDAYRLLISVVPPTDPPSPTVNLRSDRDRSPQPKPVTVKPSSSGEKNAPTPAVQASPPTREHPPSNPPSFQHSPTLSPAERQLKQSSYEQLLNLLRERRFPRAVALVEGLAQRLPHDIEVRQWQAITYQRFGRYLISVKESEKAKIYLNKALRTDPHNRSLWHEVERDLRRVEQVELL